MDIFGREELGYAGGFTCTGCGNKADPYSACCAECGAGAEPKIIERYEDAIQPGCVPQNLHEKVYAGIPPASQRVYTPVDKGFVYFIGPANDDGPIKIGFTAGEAKNRLRSLQTGHPHPLKILAVFEGSVNMEKEVHRRFAEARVHGEWFNRTPELLQMISGET